MCTAPSRQTINPPSIASPATKPLSTLGALFWMGNLLLPPSLSSNRVCHAATPAIMTPMPTDMSSMTRQLSRHMNLSHPLLSKGSDTTYPPPPLVAALYDFVVDLGLDSLPSS